MNARPDPQALALHQGAALVSNLRTSDWDRLQTRLRDIIWSCDRAVLRLKACKHPAAKAHLPRVKSVRSKARFILNDSCTPAMADYHLGFFGPNGRGQAIDYAIELANKAVDHVLALNGERG